MTDVPWWRKIFRGSRWVERTIAEEELIKQETERRADRVRRELNLAERLAQRGKNA